MNDSLEARVPSSDIQATEHDEKTKSAIEGYALWILSLHRQYPPEKAAEIIARAMRARDLKAEWLRSKAYTDRLTQIANRRALDEEFLRRKKAGKAFGVLMIDLDRFKRVNDRYSHATGDLVLVEATQTMSSSVRQNRDGGND